jgi:L-aspartate oxidase
VVPAAHYTCGGVITDARARTDLPGLYAIGETAYTGLHGANRMASNSLLECLVFAELAAQDIEASRGLAGPADAPAWDASRVTEPDEEVVISHNWEELRRFMWDYVGIVRTNKRLQRAKRRIDLLRQEIIENYSDFRVETDLLELRNLVEVADLIVAIGTSAGARAAACTTRSTSRTLHPAAATAGKPVRQPDAGPQTPRLNPAQTA